MGAVYILLAIVALVTIWPFVKILRVSLAPEETCSAVCLSKRTYSRRHDSKIKTTFSPALMRNSRTLFSGAPYYAFFYATFETYTGEIELQMYWEDYKELEEGGRYEIVYKKTWLERLTKISGN